MSFHIKLRISRVLRQIILQRNVILFHNAFQTDVEEKIIALTLRLPMRNFTRAHAGIMDQREAAG